MTREQEQKLNEQSEPIKNNGTLEYFPKLDEIFYGNLPNQHVLFKIGLLKKEDLNDPERIQEAIRKYVPPKKKAIS